MNERARTALERLRDGNRRFCAGTGMSARPRPTGPVEQRPFAIVLGCSDSRVPAEIVFDQGLGDLFVIRIAGNVVAPSQIGSIEFAAEQFGSPLVVVMGHTECGAVSATLDELMRDEEVRSPNLRAIVDRIRPAVESLLRETSTSEAVPDTGTLLARAIRANVNASVAQLLSDSALIEAAVTTDQLSIVGAEYSLESGSVEFWLTD